MPSDVGILILRVVVGLLFIGHGSQKLFGWFGGQGFKGTSQWLASLRFWPPGFWAVTVGLVEFGGGILLALGLLSPIGSLAIAASMLTAIAKVHWPKIWVTEGGSEYPVVNIAAVTAIALTGPGLYSLDRQLATAMPDSLVPVLVGLTLIGWLLTMVTTVEPVPAEVARPTASETVDEDRMRPAA